MTTLKEKYLCCIEGACDALDGLEEYGIGQGDAPGLLVMHGAAMYARDISRAATGLLRAGQTLAAGALARVVIEHAVIVQWVMVDPEARGQLFLDQSWVERTRWFEVVLKAGFDLTDPRSAAVLKIKQEQRSASSKPKNVAPEFDTVKNLFGDTDSGRQLYLTYRNLSRFVHPSAATFARYTSAVDLGGLKLRTVLVSDQDPEAIAFYLASATVMCALPYFKVLDEVEAADAVGEAARAAGVVTSLIEI